MRLAVFSDIHGNDTAFAAMQADLASVGDVDLVWCLGDLVAFGGQVKETMVRIRAMADEYGKDKFKSIGGNTDRYVVRGARYNMPLEKDEASFKKRVYYTTQRDISLNWNLSQLSWEDYDFIKGTLGREIYKSVAGFGTIIGVHAIPGDDESTALAQNSSDEQANDALLDREGRLILVGHTHQQFERKVGNWTVVNPGSVGMSFDKKGYAQWALLTFEDGDVTVDLRSVPFDVDETIAQAEKNGFPDIDELRSKFNS